MSWQFDTTGWAGPPAHALTVADLVAIQGDIRAPGGDVVYGGNYVQHVRRRATPSGRCSRNGLHGHGRVVVYLCRDHHHRDASRRRRASSSRSLSVTPSGYNVALVPVTAVASDHRKLCAREQPRIAYTSGGTLTVGQTPQSGMIAVDGLGVLKRYFSGAWASITAASQTPWSQDIDGGGFKLTNLTSLVLTPAAVPTGVSGRLAVNPAKALQVYDGSAWQYTGLQDSGGNGILKRTARDTTAVATQGTDYYKPGGTAIAVTDLPVMVASGASHAAGIVPDPPSSGGTTKFLREDGTWQIPASSGLGDSGSNGLVKRTALNTTTAATAGSDYYAPGGGTILYTDLPVFAGSGTGHHAGAVPDPGSTTGSTKFLCENGSFAVPAITAIQGVQVSSAAPLDTQVLAYDAASGQWQPTAAGGGGANATQIQGRNVAATAPTDGYSLRWNAGASEWQPTNPSLAAQYASYGYTSVNQSVASGSNIVLAFEQSVFDRGSIHSTSVNNSRFTAPVAGTYLITAGVAFAGLAANATLGISIRVNGTSIYTNQYTYNISGAASWFSACFFLDLNPTDYIEAIVWQNSGSALLLNASGNRYCYCQMVMLG
jgi:hypothetical protein